LYDAVPPGPGCGQVAAARAAGGLGLLAGRSGGVRHVAPCPGGHADPSRPDNGTPRAHHRPARFVTSGVREAMGGGYTGRVQHGSRPMPRVPDTARRSGNR